MSATPNQQWTHYRNGGLTNTLIQVRSGPTDIFGYYINNPNAAEEFVQMFDAADVSEVTLGTTACTLPLKIPNSGMVEEVGGRDPLMTFPRGLVIAATTTETGSSAPGSALSVSIRYR